MTVLLFASRFAPLVEEGVKLQTIRGPRARPIKPGDVLSLRAWEGTAYRSPQRVLRRAVCASVEPIRIDWASRLRIEVSGLIIPPIRLGEFVRADGFGDTTDFTNHWWESIPFEGILIKWKFANA